MNIFDEEPTISLNDLGGIYDIKKTINDYIRINITNKISYEKLGFERSRKHILIKGPEGSGKTSLALAISKVIGYPHIRINLYDARVFSTLSDNKLSNYLLLLVKNSPCTIIIDDID
jgi:SpoVK/Ycf46/Vps4 family AAA+-type ATPase